MARKTTTAEAQITKTCTKTGETFTGTLEELAEFFYRDKSQKDGLSSWSKDAERAYAKAYTAGLKKARASKKAAIADAKGAKAFEAAMQPERVARKSKKVTGTRTTRTTAGKARATATRKARKTATALTEVA